VCIEIGVVALVASSHSDTEVDQLDEVLLSAVLDQEDVVGSLAC